MKKKSVLAVVILSSIVFGACGTAKETTESTTKDTQQVEAVTVTISLTEGDKLLSKEELEVPAGETLETILVDHFQAEASDGMVTAIAGHKQEPDKNKYWLFNVNDKPSMVGANNYKVQENDKIDWTLDILK